MTFYKPIFNLFQKKYFSQYNANTFSFKTKLVK